MKAVWGLKYEVAAGLKLKLKLKAVWGLKYEVAVGLKLTEVRAPLHLISHYSLTPLSDAKDKTSSDYNQTGWIQTDYEKWDEVTHSAGLETE